MASSWFWGRLSITYTDVPCDLVLIIKLNIWQSGWFQANNYITNEMNVLTIFRCRFQWQTYRFFHVTLKVFMLDIFTLKLYSVLSTTHSSGDSMHGHAVSCPIARKPDYRTLDMLLYQGTSQWLPWWPKPTFLVYSYVAISLENIWDVSRSKSSTSLVFNVMGLQQWTSSLNLHFVALQWPFFSY